MKWLKNLEFELLDSPLFTIAGTPVTLATIVVFVLILIAAYTASRLLQRGVRRALALRKVTDPGTVEVMARLLHYLVLGTGAAIGLQTIGIDLSALVAAGAIFAVGLGFAMQNIAQNFVSGVILLTERTIKPGDVLQVEGRFVKVHVMGIRSTIARTLDEEEIIVPNSMIAQSAVTNYTLRDSLYRLRASVGVVYSADMREVRRVLEKVATDIPWRIQDREPVVLLAEFGASSVDWEVSVWMNDPWSMRRAKSQLHEAIWWALKDAGIPIAFPQLDVHFDPPVVDALRKVV